MINETTKLALRLMKIIKEGKSNNFFIGVVKQTKPLVVIIHGLEFTEEDFSKNYIFSSKKDVNLNLIEENYHHDFTGEMTYENYFNLKDRLLFLKLNDELILLCKVV